MRKKIIISICGIICAFTLVGCNQEVEITGEESELIAEYSAGILLKYDKNYDSRLSDIVSNESYDLPEDTEVPQIEETTESMENSSVTELPISNENLNSIDDTVTVVEGNMNEILMLEQFDIVYTGFEITDFYPHTGSDENMDFVVNPKTGNKLLVIKFSLKNSNHEMQQIDLLIANPVFNIIVNDTVTFKNIKTVLLNDLSTIAQNMEAETSMETVLLFEIPIDYEEEVNSMVLNVNLNDAAMDVVLQ